MDIQIKRGLLDVCVLAAIKGHDSYGYRIVKDMKPYVEISESTLYPILKRLEAGECLSSYSVEHNGRLRRFYRITSKGRDRIRDYLLDFRELQKVYEFIAGEVKENAE